MRPIDADALRIIKVEECEGYTIDYYAAGWKACIDWIKTLPTLDVVPVIRCTKCKYYGPGDHAGFWRCENWGVDINSHASPPETFYCADGEPKEEET